MNKNITRLCATGVVLTTLMSSLTSANAATFKPLVKTIYMNGSSFNHPYGIVSQGTTYMPIWYVQQALNQLGINNSWNGNTRLWQITAPSYTPVDLSNVANTHGDSTITLNGKSMYHINRIIVTDPSSKVATTYMPIWYIIQLLNRLGIGSTWNGTSWHITSPPPLSVTVADPSQYPTLDYGKAGYPVVLLQQKLNSAGYNVGAIDGNFGTATKVAVETFQAASGITPDGIVGQDTWLKLNQRLATLFAPASVSSTTASTSGQSHVMVWATNGASMTDAENLSNVTQINNDNYNLNTNGTVSDSTSGTNTLATLMASGMSRNASVFATVTNISASTGNFSGSLISSVLNNASERSTLESSLTNVAVNDGYQGIDLDFENVEPSDEAIFTQFLSELATQLHASNKQLSVTVPAETGATSEPWDGAYNYPAIGNIADVVPVMSYDFSWSGSAAGAVAPLYWDEQVMKYATTAMPANKILMGLAAYGYDWNLTTGTPGVADSLPKIDSLMSQYNATQSWDATDASPYFTYTDGSGNHHIVYYENQASIEQKLTLATEYGVGGVAVWKAGIENTPFWNAISGWVATTTQSTASASQSTTSSSTSTN